jgi:hypothetical protein
MIPRIGNFLIVVSIGFLILFVGSILGKSIHFENLFYCIIFASLGLFLRSRAEPKGPSARFAAVRRAREKSNQRREQRTQKQPEKK